MNTLDYENLVHQFESALLTQLRGHNNDSGFLEMWVPDLDPVKSILCMVESAELGGVSKFNLRINLATLSGDALIALEFLLKSLSTLSHRIEDKTHLVLTFSDIGLHS